MPGFTDRTDQPQEAAGIGEYDPKVYQKIKFTALIQEVHRQDDDAQKAGKGDIDEYVESSLGSLYVLEQPGYLTGRQAKTTNPGGESSNIRTFKIDANIALCNGYGNEKRNINYEKGSGNIPQVSGNHNVHRDHRDRQGQVQSFSLVGLARFTHTSCLLFGTSCLNFLAGNPISVIIFITSSHYDHAPYYKVMVA